MTNTLKHFYIDFHFSLTLDKLHRADVAQCKEPRRTDDGAAFVISLFCFCICTCGLTILYFSLYLHLWSHYFVFVLTFVVSLFVFAFLMSRFNLFCICQHPYYFSYLCSIFTAHHCHWLYLLLKSEHNHLLTSFFCIGAAKAAMSPYSIPSHETLLGPPGLPTLKYWDDFFIRRFVKTMNWDLWRLLSRRFVKKTTINLLRYVKIFQKNICDNNQFTSSSLLSCFWGGFLVVQSVSSWLEKQTFKLEESIVKILPRREVLFASSRQRQIQRQTHLPVVAQVAKSFKEVVVDTCHSDICRVVYICDDDSYSGLLVFHLSVVLLMKCIPSRYIWEDDSFSGYNVFSQDIFVRMILLRITRLRSFQLNRTLPRWMIDRYRKIFDNCKIRSQYWKW